MRRRSPRPLVVLLAGAVAVLASSCTVAADGGDADGASDGDAAEQAPAEGPAAVPSSWRPHQVEGLAFALPDFMEPSADLIPGTTETLRAGSGVGEVPAAAGVFVETADLGPLDVRTEIIRQVRVDQLGEDPVGGPRALAVDGAEGAVVLTWEWDYEYPGGPTVPSRQIEVVVASDGEQQYGMLLGGPADVVTEDVVEDFLASLSVSGAGQA